MSKITKIIDVKITGTDELVRLEKEITKNEQKLRNMTKAGKKNAGMQKIHAKNIAETRVKLKQLRGARNQEQKAILSQTQASVKLDGSYNSLVQRQKQLLTRIKSTQGGMSSQTAEMRKMKQEYIDNNQKLKDFDAELGNNQRNVGNYGSALGSTREKFAQVGVAVAGAIAGFTALSRLVSSATDDFGEFEKTFTNVLTLMSSDDINQFGETMKTGAIDVMKEFGFEIADLNKALFDSVSAGVPASESIDFLRTASELAVGGVTDLSTAVDGITSVVNAYGLETSEADRVASAFFTAQKFGKTTVGELSETIGSVAPIARQAGISYQELLSSFAELTKQGISTDKASTALRSSITALIKPSKDAQKIMDKLGITYGASGIKQEGFFNILTRISEVAEAQPDLLAQIIPNVRALTGVGALGTAQLEEYSEILQQVTDDYGENSSLANAVTMQSETLEQQLASSKAEFRAMRIEVGEKLKPAVIAILDGFTSLLGNMDKIVKVLKQTATGFVIAKTAMLAYRIATLGLGKALGIAAIKQRALNIATKANPYVLAATALVGLVSMLVNFRKATTEATAEQKKLNAEVQKNKGLIADTKDIEDRIKIYNKLNDSQKEQLNASISSALTELQTTQASIKVFRNKNDQYKKNLARMREINKEYKNVNQSTFEGTMAALRLAQEQKNLKEANDKLELKNFGVTYDNVTAKVNRYSKATKVITNDLKKQDDTVKDLNISLDDEENKLLSLENAMKLEESTLEQLGEKIKQLKGNRDKLVIGSEEFIKVTEEIERVQKKQTEATKKTVDDDQKKIESIQKRIDEERATIDILRKVRGFEDETMEAGIKLRQAQIDLILKQAEIEGTLSDQQIANLQKLKGEIESMNNTMKTEEGLSTFEEAFYGEGVKNALAGLSASLDVIQQQGQGQAMLDQVNADNRIHQIETEKEAAIKNLEESSAFKVLSQEEQDAKMLELTQTFDDQANKIRETQFNKQKKLDKSEARIAGALSIMRIYSSKITGNAVVDAILKIALIATQIQNTNKQIAAINATQFRAEFGGIVPEKFAQGGMVKGPRHAQGGVKFAVGGQVAELEGGEAVINRRSTAMFRSQLSAMNEAGGGKSFADGGMIQVQQQLEATANRSIITDGDVGRIAMALGSQRVTVLESDVTQTQETISVLESRAEF